MRAVGFTMAPAVTQPHQSFSINVTFRKAEEGQHSAASMGRLAFWQIAEQERRLHGGVDAAKDFDEI
jgi:hypothetical protein